MTALAVHALAALGEIAGCFAFRVWLRLGRSALWILLGLVSSATFAALLTRVDVRLAGRAFAASLLWLWAVEGQRPDAWDGIGAALSRLGAAVILASHTARS